jgi:hypothetical protein
MAGNRTVRVPKLMVGTQDIATHISTVTSHIADAGKHREINDSGGAVTDLWSGSKITTELAGKLSTGSAAGDLGANDITVAMLEIDNADTDEYSLTYDSGTGNFRWEERVKTDGSNLTLAANSITEAMIDITTAAGAGTDNKSLTWVNDLGECRYQA